MDKTDSPGFGCHDFGSVLLRGITITGENLEAAVSGKHPQIHKDLSGKRFPSCYSPERPQPWTERGCEFSYMLLEELLLSFGLVQEQISGPVCGRERSEGFLQVVVFLEALDELLQLLLTSFNGPKPAEKQRLVSKPTEGA